MDPQYLMSRIEDLDRAAIHLPLDLLREDITGLTIEILCYIGRVIDVESLSQTLVAREHVDLDALRKVADIFSTLNLTGPYKLFPERELDPSAILENYKLYLQELSNHGLSLSSPYLAWELGFGCHSLMELLICAAAQDADLSDIVSIVEGKLELLNEDQIINIWSQIQEEFNIDRSYFGEVGHNVMPPDWLKTTNIEETKKKIATYVVGLRWHIAVCLFRTGRYNVPNEAPSLAQILAISSTAAGTPVSQFELELARALARLYIFWCNVLDQREHDFLHSIGLAGRPSFLRSQSYQGASSTAKIPEKSSIAVILFELRKVLNASQSFVGNRTPIEKALMQYKLGTEVMAPEIIKRLAVRNELSLQRELCKFLLERDVFAVGTKFGRSELDLLAELPTEGFVIEAKIYKYSKRITEKTIKSNLVQLQSYMDQSPVHRRGILVIYNFSPLLIAAPRGWVGGRYWFLPINLQAKPPSGRDRSIVIEPGEGGNLIRISTVIPPVGKGKGDVHKKRIPEK